MISGSWFPFSPHGQKKMIAHAAKSNRKSMQRLLRSIPAPGTIHACKNLFPEEVYVSVGFEAYPAIFVDAL